MALLSFHYFCPVTRGCSYNQCLPLALFIISIFAPSGQSLSSTGSMSGRLGNIFSLHCTLGSKREHSDLMLPLLPDAQATFRLSWPTVYEEMVIISNYKMFFYSPRHHPEVFFPLGEQSILPCGLGSRLMDRVLKHLTSAHTVSQCPNHSQLR